MTVGDRLREYRKTYAKLTLEEFGKRIGFGKSAISEVENGNNAMSKQMKTAICKEFNLNEEWLMEGIGDPERKLTADEELAQIFGRMLFTKEEGDRKRLMRLVASLTDEECHTAVMFLDKIKKG